MRRESQFMIAKVEGERREWRDLVGVRLELAAVHGLGFLAGFFVHPRSKGDIFSLVLGVE